MSRGLQQLENGLWVVEQLLGNPMANVNTRMTVIRLRDGGLWLHSPVRLTQEIRADLDRLGPVVAVVSPNRHHHLFAGDYPTGYPKARLFAAPGLPEKRPDLKFAEVLSDEAPSAWRADLQQLVFRGAPFLSEVVFFHPATRTLVFTDLAFNVPRGGTAGARLFYFIAGAEGRFGPHRIARWFFRDKVAARESLERILRWDFERVIVTHGDVLERGGPAAVREGFAFLG
jgi:hypothetical protein